MAGVFTTSGSESKKSHLFFDISFLLLLLLLLLLLIFFLTTQNQSSNIPPSLHQATTASSSPKIPPLHVSQSGCIGLQRYKDAASKCAFLQTDTECKSDSYIDYLRLFYCTCGPYPALGYAVLILWLLLLFYLLGNTAACYFCSSLESLSRLLKLSPTIAGVTLLALGNGAPDVFASFVSFMRPGSDGDVGLNSVLGGAFFVSSGVVGIISIWVGPRCITIDRRNFLRDICFYIVALCSLLAILIVGQINLWGAIAFTSLYFIYVFVVSATHFCWKNDKLGGVEPLLPIDKRFFSCESDQSSELGVSLLGVVDAEKPNLISEQAAYERADDEAATCFGLNTAAFSYYFGKFLSLVELPLYLPRRLTIPVVSEERWSKPFAVISVSLAPVLLAALWNSQNGDMDFKGSLAVYITGGVIGLIFGAVAFFTTNRCGPPKRFLFPWLAGGFLMSVIWTYAIAEELVASLVSLGNIVGISPSILGLTVLAWGNSLGDLIANVAMALKGGPDGAQIAICGCYAGPMFNTLMGLGLSLVFSSSRVNPSPYVIPGDPSLYQTLVFLLGGLLWALIILMRKGMRLDKVLGGGLLAIYFCFLSLRLAHALGWV